MTRVFLVLLAALCILWGWSAFWFVCDDAYIAFRYVSNSQLGYGYTWNAPPFEPVEGYTSFLWVVLLDWTWTLTGIEPPVAANPLSLGFAMVQLAFIVGLVDALPLHTLRRHRTAVLALVLFATVTNRTFLAWTTSGLETSMFDAFVLGWVYFAVTRNPTGLAAFATLLALTRPDGLLYCVSTVVIVLVMRRPFYLWPLAFAALHEAWRIAVYGAPLPNTYYAKVGPAWPEMGLAYLASFLLEYGFWVLLPLVGLGIRHLWNHPPHVGWPPVLVRLLWIGTLLFHLGYYTFKIGGDHFEYRVYAWAVPLVWLAAISVFDAMGWSPRRAFAWLGTAFLLGLPLPWMLWWQTRDVEVAFQKGMPDHDVAPDLPIVLAPIAVPFDLLQDAMIGRWVGMRSQTHKIFSIKQRNKYPSRTEGSKIRDGLPVMRAGAVGMPGWVFPHVAIMDAYGLNDPIIARNPQPRRRGRLMAHERQVPKGYMACFDPNVLYNRDEGVFTVVDRVLTPTQVVQCQKAGWASLGY